MKTGVKTQLIWMFNTILLMKDNRRGQNLRTRKKWRRILFAAMALILSLASTSALSAHTALMESSDGSESYQSQMEAGILYGLSQPLDETHRLKVFAHRGLDSSALQNSFAAYDAAAAAGCPQIELDVWQSKDGVYYISHDNNLKTMTGQDVTITSLNSSDLDAMSLTNGEKMHRLTDLFDHYGNSMMYLIEFKQSEANANAFYTIMRNYPSLASHIEVQSFYENVMDEIHQLMPNLYCQLLVRDDQGVEDGLKDEALSAIAVKYTLMNTDLVEDVHDSGKELWVWTVDSLAAAQKYLDWGVDGVITNSESVIDLAKEYSE